jgi:hypothetical protein
MASAQAGHSHHTTSARGWRRVGPRWTSTRARVGVGVPHSGQSLGARLGAVTAAHPHE